MNVLEMLGDFLGLIFILLFAGMIVIFAVAARRQPARGLRDISAFSRLRRAVGLAVEAGTRLHVSLGYGGVNGTQGSSGLHGLTVLERIARAASISDRPPIATSGEGTLAILSQDTLRNASRASGAESQADPIAGRFTGATPFSYAAGAMPVIHDEKVSANVLIGHFGSEIALLTEASERSGGLTVAGSDNLPAQAVLYAAADEPLVGEEMYASGAYLGAGTAHVASLRAQDAIRWLLAFVILLGALARLVGLI